MDKHINKSKWNNNGLKKILQITYIGLGILYLCKGYSGITFNSFMPFVIDLNIRLWALTLGYYLLFVNKRVQK